MKRYPSRMGVGASSILLILVILSLTLFAVLSLVQAKNDAALTDKTASAVTAFYDADAQAQRLLSQLDAALTAGEDLTAIGGVTKAADGWYVFSIGASDGHTLNVSFSVDDGYCAVKSYRYESTSEWTGEDVGTLWQGG